MAFNLAMFAWTELKYGGWATISALAMLCVLHWFGDVSVFKFIATHPQCVIGGAFAYFVVGTFWAIAKWWFYTKNERRRYEILRANFLERKNLVGPSIPDEFKDAFRFSLIGDVDVKPKVSEHREDIYHWIAFWPWSLLWTLINDPIKRIIEWIYNCIRAFLQSISDRAWAGTENDHAGK